MTQILLQRANLAKCCIVATQLTWFHLSFLLFCPQMLKLLLVACPVVCTMRPSGKADIVWLIVGRSLCRQKKETCGW